MKFKLLRFSLLSMLVLLCGGGIFAIGHALSKAQDEASYVYQKITSTDDLSDGEYLIVYETGNVALNGGLATLDAANNTVDVTIENGQIASSATVDAATFTIAGAAMGMTIKSSSGYYIGMTSYGNGLKQSETLADGYYQTIGFDGDGNTLLTVTTSGGDVTMKYNSASNQNRFRYYKSGQQAVQLYKKVSVTTTDDRTATSVTLGEYQKWGFKDSSYELPSATVKAGDTPIDALVTWSSSNESVAIIDNGQLKTLAAGKTTLKASFAGDANNKPSYATLDFIVVDANYANLQEVQEAATSTSTPIMIKTGGQQVVFVKGSNAYLADDQGYGVLIYSQNHGLQAGDKLMGYLVCNLTTYQGNVEITDLMMDGVEKTTADVVPVEKAVGNITKANQSTLVTLKNVTYQEVTEGETTTKTLTDGTNSIIYYDKFQTNAELTNGQQYDVTGIIVLYNDKIEIAPRTAADIAEPAAAAGFRDIKLNLMEHPEVLTGSDVYITVAEDGTIGTTENAADAAATVKGNVHSYGSSNFTASVPVEGCVKITYATHDYGNDIIVTNDAGEQVAKLNTMGEKWMNNHDNVAVTYYRTNAPTTLHFSKANYNPYFAVEAIDEADLPAEVTIYNITFAVGDDVTGVVPAALEVEAGGKFTAPKNYTLYKEGYTLNGWESGDAIYLPGQEVTPEADMTLTAHFVQNEVSLADRNAAVIATFTLNGTTGQHKFEGNTGVIVTQATVNGKSIDVKADVNATGGKFAYNGSGWHQVNQGTKVTVPSCKDAVISVSLNNGDASFMTFAGNAGTAADNVVSYTATAEDATCEIAEVSNNYWNKLVVTLPAEEVPVVNNDLLWAYDEEHPIPTTSPDNGLYFGAYVNDAAGTNNGMHGVKLNASGWAYFEKAPVAGKLTLTFGNRKTAGAYAVNVYKGTLDDNNKGVKGDLIGEIAVTESPGTGSIELGADVTGVYIERKTSSEGVLSKIVFKETKPRTFVDFEITNEELSGTFDASTLPAGVTFQGTQRNDSHGYGNVTIVVPVDGTVKFTIGGCQYANPANCKVTNAAGEVLATPNLKTTNCYHQTGTDIATRTATYIYVGEPTTLTFSDIAYLPYFKAEATEVQEAVITYKDQNGNVLGTKTVYEGDAIGEIPYTEEDLNIGVGVVFRGWVYTSGIKVKPTDIVNGNVTVSALVTPLESTPEVGSVQTYDLTKATFYPEDHENFNIEGGYYHDGQHGWAFGNGGKFQVVVGGKAQIVLTLCQYGSATATFSVLDEVRGVVIANNVPGVAETDGATTTVNYEGPQASLLTFTYNTDGENYLHCVKVYNVSEFVEKDEASGYYIIPAGDGAGLIMAINQASSEENSKIFLPNGTYDLGETVLTGISGKNVSIIGESMEGVVIKNAPDVSLEGLGKADLLVNTGEGLYLQDLTLQNALDYMAAGSAGRAVTLHDKGTKTINKNVRHLSHQDTYYSHKSGGLYYFEGGEIHGTVDYMCGNGKAYFNKVTLVNEQRATATMTANSELYVFNECVVKNNADQYNFGRAWSDHPVCIYLNTTLEDPDRLSSSRWNLTGINCDYSIAGEYGTKNAQGEDITPASNNVTFTKENTQMNTILDASALETYSIQNVLGDWAATAQAQAEQVTAPTAELKDGTISWQAVDGATAYALFKNGEFLGITTETSFVVGTDDAAASNRAEANVVYTIRAANERGGFGEPTLVTIADGIQKLNVENIEGLVIYDLQGRRVNTVTSGIYIINGSKVMIK